jgi:hypothetical protein
LPFVAVIAPASAPPKHLAHVAHLAQVVPDERLAECIVVGRERVTRRFTALERAPCRLSGEPARFDRVMNALQRGHVHEADTVTGEQQPGRVELLRQRDEPALRNRLRAPLHTLAALEDLPHARMRLQFLQHVVHG